MNLVKRRAHQFGVRGFDPESLSFDLVAAVKRKDAIVDGIVSGIHRDLQKNSAITYLTGRAAFASPGEIRVDDRLIAAEKTILAVGAQVAPPHIPGLKEAGYITNDEALHLSKLPASMIIIGAGYVGVEFAQMYARFGTRVTLVGRAPRIMPREEPELSDLLGEILRADGIDVLTSTEVTAAGPTDGRRFVDIRRGEEVERLEAEVLLLAAGRTARTGDLGLEQAGVELNDGFVGADDHLRTSAANIWSLGDANGGDMFTHRAIYDGPISALNAVRAKDRAVDYRVVPRAAFTEPALASVGLTELQARDAGREVKVGRELFAGYGRAQAIMETDGLVKLVIDASTNEILGGHILGPHADLLIHQVTVAMHDHGKLDRLTHTIHVHPTLSEVVKGAAKAAR